MKKKILIIDDNDELRLFLKKSLEKEGHTVIPSADTISAIERLITNDDIDVIVTDYRVGPIDDDIWLKFLDKFYKDKKIIIISGYTLKDFGSEGIKYIKKPFDLSQLLEAVE